MIDDDGVGGAITDLLGSPREFAVYPFSSVKDYEAKDKRYHDRRTEAYFKVLDWLEKGWLKILNDSIMITQLLTIKKKYDLQGRLWVVPKDQMKDERGNAVPSPDRADALMMAVWFADEVMSPEFAQNHPVYAPIQTDLNSERQPDGFMFDGKNPEYSNQQED